MMLLGSDVGAMFTELVISSIGWSESTGNRRSSSTMTIRPLLVFSVNDEFVADELSRDSSRVPSRDLSGSFGKTTRKFADGVASPSKASLSSANTSSESCSENDGIGIDKSVLLDEPKAASS
jgi:hypothetical protein